MILRSIKAILIALIAVAFIVFSVVNRQTVTVSLYPLPYEAVMPEFLLAIACVAIGAIIGGLTVSIRLCKIKLQANSEHKRVVALEHEVSAMHAEQAHLQATPLPAPGAGQ